ncbi:MAG: hypothetical protein AB1555_16945 [Nitrospirota bacterium]
MLLPVADGVSMLGRGSVRSTDVRLSANRIAVRTCTVVVLGLLALELTACDKLTGLVRRTPLPDMGPRLPVSVKLTFDPSLTNARAQYIDACNSPYEIPLGAELESVLLDAAAQNFQSVSASGANPQPTSPTYEIHIDLQRSGLKLLTDNIYDRVPAELVLEAVATFKDASGTVVNQQALSVQHKQRLILEPTQRRCNYGNMDEFIYEAAVALSTQFVRAARAQYESGSRTVSPAPPAPAAQAQAVPPSGPAPTRSSISAVSFKATLVDENGDLLLEGGERLRVRIDLANGGGQAVHGVSASIAGTPAVVSQFPATTLPVGTLQPGDSRSIEFVATLPPSIQPQRGELQVTLLDPSGAPIAPVQTLTASIRSRDSRPEAADAAPTVPTALRRLDTYVVAIGLSLYRDQQIPGRKYAARDAEHVAASFRSLGGVPAANVRVLQDVKALRPDIEEALLDWLPTRVHGESLVIVYFAGQAFVASTGETFLVPYDGGSASPSRLYPLKELEAALAKLHPKQTLFIFDGGVARLGGDARTKSKPPRWDAANNGVIHLIGLNGFGKGLESDKLRHGLFTHYLLRGLEGDADANRDGAVTLGELIDFLDQKVPAAAKSGFSLEQRPLIVPALRPTDAVAGVILTQPGPGGTLSEVR